MNEDTHVSGTPMPPPDDDDLPLRRPILPEEDNSYLAMTRFSEAVTEEGDAVWPSLEETMPHSHDDLPPLPSSTLAPPPPVGPPPVYHAPRETRRERLQRKRRGQTARERRESPLYLPWWSLLVLLAVVAFFVALLLMGLRLLGGGGQPGGETPIVIVITNTPTPLPTTIPPTSIPLPTAIPQPGVPTQAPGDIASATPDPLAGEHRVGATVEVNAEQLNIRDGPGLGFEPLYLAPQGSRFLIIDGPQDADDHTWWQVQFVENANQQGWAAQEFLDVVAP